MAGCSAFTLQCTGRALQAAARCSKPQQTTTSCSMPLHAAPGAQSRADSPTVRDKLTRPAYSSMTLDMMGLRVRQGPQEGAAGGGGE